jgi:hypothetical protein
VVTFTGVHAMKWISPLVSDARNKIGGDVFARNRAGVYARARVSPTQPRTTSQQNNRALFASFATQWKTLSQTDIAGWNTLASTIVLKDTLGGSYNPTGFQLFVGNNRNLSFIGAANITTPPATKPNIASTDITLLSLTTSGGAPYDQRLGLSNGFAIATPNAIISMTAGLSPGVNFIPRWAYRRLAPPWANGGGVLLVLTNYAAVFGDWKLGSKIGVLVQPVDPATGFAGTPVSAVTLVTGT